MDNERRLFITGNETNETNEDNVQDEYWLDENFSETNEDNVQDKDRLDEELISAVKNRPALYDSSLPVKQRGRKQKDCLLNEISVHLKGLYTPSEAEKRWNYLRDCYRKAKSVFKKRQAVLQGSGTARILKSETIMPSFRHYSEMTFLNNTLEHRQTVTSFKAAINNEQTSTSRANIDDVQSNISNNDTLECGLLESLNMAKICLFTKVIEWKKSLILNCHKEIERKKLIKAT